MYLGFDFSTQQVKAVIVSSDLARIVGTWTVSFDADLPQYGTKSGVHQHSDGVTVTAPTLMWVEALDLLLGRMKDAGAPLGEVQALSGAGQQHGSVYWARGAEATLNQLLATEPLHDQLRKSFAVADSPIWMDSSTDAQIVELENTVGGAMELAKLTGSRGYHRFTGPQIMKVRQTNPDGYEKTERISLVSSFAASLFLGAYAPIDWSDGSGMNLLEIHNGRAWNQALLDTCGPNLLQRLGEPAPPDSVLGTVSPYLVQRHGFSPDCKVCVFTGDNPSSLIGLQLGVGDMAISLGTSDTVFLAAKSVAPDLNAHILCHPMLRDAFMAMLCFKNGAITRANARGRCGSTDWTQFNQLLAKTEPGNGGNIGFYYDFPEILPEVGAGCHRFDPSGNQVDTFPPEIEARAVIESQCLSKLVHVGNISATKPTRVVVTGGGSKNEAILQILANVFNCPVFTQDVEHSAAVGGAYRAQMCLNKMEAKDSSSCSLVAKPDAAAVQVYEKMADKFAYLEDSLAKP